MSWLLLVLLKLSQPIPKVSPRAITPTGLSSSCCATASEAALRGMAVSGSASHRVCGSSPRIRSTSLPYSSVQTACSCTRFSFVTAAQVHSLLRAETIAARALSLQMTRVNPRTAAPTRKVVGLLSRAGLASAILLQGILFICVVVTFNAAAVLLLGQQHRIAAALKGSRGLRPFFPGQQQHTASRDGDTSSIAVSRVRDRAAEKRGGDGVWLLLWLRKVASTGRRSSSQRHSREDSSTQTSRKCRGGCSRDSSSIGGSYIQLGAHWSGSCNSRVRSADKNCCSTSQWGHRSTPRMQGFEAENATAIEAAGGQHLSREYTAAAMMKSLTVNTHAASVVGMNVVFAGDRSSSLSNTVGISTTATRSSNGKDVNSKRFIHCQSNRRYAAGGRRLQWRNANTDVLSAVVRLPSCCVAALLKDYRLPTICGSKCSTRAVVVASAGGRDMLRDWWAHRMCVNYLSNVCFASSCTRSKCCELFSRSSRGSSGGRDRCSSRRNPYAESYSPFSSSIPEEQGESSSNHLSRSALSCSTFSRSTILLVSNTFRSSGSRLRFTRSTFTSSTLHSRSVAGSKIEASLSMVDSGTLDDDGTTTRCNSSASSSSSTVCSSWNRVARNVGQLIPSQCFGRDSQCRRNSSRSCCSLKADLCDGIAPLAMGGDIAPLAAAPMMEHTDRHWRKLISLMSSRLVLYSEMLSLPAAPEKRILALSSSFSPSRSSVSSSPCGDYSESQENYLPQLESLQLLQNTDVQRVALPLRCRQQLQREVQSFYDLVNPMVIQLGTHSPAAAAAAAEVLWHSVTHSGERRKLETDTTNSCSFILGSNLRSNRHTDEKKEEQHQWSIFPVHINLNCGCPSSRVASGGFGLALMEKPAAVASICNALYDSFHRHSRSSSPSSGSTDQEGQIAVPVGSARQHSSDSLSPMRNVSRKKRRQSVLDALERQMTSTIEAGTSRFGKYFTVSVKCRVGAQSGEVGSSAFRSSARRSNIGERYLRDNNSSSGSCRIKEGNEKSDKVVSGNSTRFGGSSSCTSSYMRLANFVHDVASQSPVRHFIVHARPGILTNEELSSSDHRKRGRVAANPPALLPQYVYRLCTDFPSLRFSFNGGVTSFEDAAHHLVCAPQLAGVMVGRGFIEKPWYWAANADKYIATVQGTGGKDHNASATYYRSHFKKRQSTAMLQFNKSRITDKVVAALERSFVAHPRFAISRALQTATIESPAAAQKCTDVIPLCRTRREVLTSYVEYADNVFRENLEFLNRSSVEQPYTSSGSVRRSRISTTRQNRGIAAAAACEASAILKPLWNLFSGETGGRAFRRLLQIHLEAFRQHLLNQQQSTYTSGVAHGCGANSGGWASSGGKTGRITFEHYFPSAIISRAITAIPDSVLDRTSEEFAADRKL